MIDSSEVFDSIRRGYNELDDASNEDIIEYFQNVDTDSISGHVSNIKGILFEQEYVEQLASEGIHAEIFEATNHPVVDISIIEDGIVVNELQLKATESVSYINSTLAEHPAVEIVATTEVASQMNSDMVIDSGISESALENTILESLDVVNPVSPLSIFGWFFGIF